MNIMPSSSMMNQTFGMVNTLRLGDRSSSFDPHLTQEGHKIDSAMAAQIVNHSTINPTISRQDTNTLG